jgi:DNA-binding protein H-NS
MATLAAMKRQIAKLEAEVARKTREEMSGAIAKIREIMATFGLTVEHLTSGATAGRAKKLVGKKAAPGKSAGKRAGAGTPKYRDPKTGATWTGFGRAPGWIASAKSRNAFLIGGHSPEATASTPPKKTTATATKADKRVRGQAAKKSAKIPVKASGAAPAAAKEAASKKAVTKKAAGKKAVAKSPKAAVKAPAKKAAKVRSSGKPAATAPVAQGATHEQTTGGTK